MVVVKICGITNLADALAALEAGADALGFNFWRGSRRFVEPRAAGEIIRALPSSVVCVGVFVDEEGPESVARAAGVSGVGAVQLHGAESPEYCAALEGLTVIKALRVGPGFRVESAAEYPADAILLDAFADGVPGGTGKTFDWAVARDTVARVARLYLAGGLTPENVGAAVAAVGPYAVDVCSGVESAPGRKDAGLVRAFVRAARRQEKT